MRAVYSVISLALLAVSSSSGSGTTSAYQSLQSLVTQLQGSLFGHPPHIEHAQQRLRRTSSISISDIGKQLYEYTSDASTDDQASASDATGEARAVGSC